MDSKFNYRYFSYTLAANGLQTVNTVGNYIILRSNTGAADTLKVSIDGEEFQTLPVGIKLVLDKQFSKLEFQNTDSGNTTFKVGTGIGNIDDNSLTVSGTLITNDTATSHSTPAAVATSTTAALLVAANTSRREVIISNNSSTSGEIVWIGDTNVSAAAGRGIPLYPGEKIVLSTQAVIWADAVTGTPSVSYMEFTS